MKVKTSKGFTLAELLIVMAIIVVLAAVAIPTFGKQLETSRETGDMEIIRNAYTDALTIAVLDAADGKINGVFGDADHADDTTTTWGSVKYAGSNKYEVTVGERAFSQAPLTGSPTPETAWKYVNPSLMGRTVPVVSSSTTKLTFEFQISSTGDVQLIEDVTTGTAKYAIAAA